MREVTNKHGEFFFATSLRVHPKLWEASSVPYKQLIDHLVALAVERHKEKQQTNFTRV